jgi:hypothetical protein
VKIIAISSPRDPHNRLGATYIAEVTDSELQRITGKDNGYLSSGDKVEVHDAWKDFEKFKNAKDRLSVASETLRAVALLVDAASISYILPTETKEEA